MDALGMVDAAARGKSSEHEQAMAIVNKWLYVVNEAAVNLATVRGESSELSTDVLSLPLAGAMRRLDEAMQVLMMLRGRVAEMG